MKILIIQKFGQQMVNLTRTFKLCQFCLNFQFKKIILGGAKRL